MARARGRDSLTRGRILDYSIRGPLTTSIYLGFIVGLVKEVASSNLFTVGHYWAMIVKVPHMKLYYQIHHGESVSITYK
jgi:hypothetical protein